MMNASTCADLNAITGDVNNFSLGQVTVVYAKSPYYYVQDATGTSLVYKANYGLLAGDVVTGLTGKATLYYGVPELSSPTAYTSLSITHGTAPTIPDATAVPTLADINKVFMFRDVDMGGQSFRLNSNNNPINLDVTFLGQTLQFRNGWKDTITFNANKTYDMVGAISRYNETLQVYVTDFVEHHETGLNPIVVGAEKPSTWNAMYLYAWADGQGALLGQWPGTAVNVDSTGWAYHTFEGLSEVNYIWNSGSGTQTENLYTDASICQRLVEPQPHLSSGNWSATAVECGSHATQPSDTTLGEPITVRLFPSTLIATEWQGAFLYAWTGDSTKILGNWPGYPVDLVDGWYSYTFPAYIQDVNIIWSNGGMSTPNQTEDITNVTASTCYSLGYRTTMIDDYATGNIHYEANVVDCASETMLMPLYLVNNQAADGDHVATEPLTVTFAKKPYFYVQNNAGTAGLIYDTRNEWTDLAFNDIITTFEGDVKIYNGLKELIPTLSYVDWGVRNRAPGEEIMIPTATSAPTTADMNKVFRFVNVSFGNASFTTETKKNITATMANGETFAARNQWQEAYTFEANKTYDFTGCVAVYNGTVQVYATNFVEHAGPTPQPGDSTLQDTITLGFGNAFAWDSVYLYAWDNNRNPLLGEWPGTPMTLDSSQWAYKTFITGESVNYIWNNGKYSSQAGARQTQDLVANASVCQAIDPVSTNYPFDVVSIQCGANPDLVFDLSFEQALAVGALADVTNPSYYTYRTTGVVSNILTSPENVDRYKNCDFFITNPTNPNDNSIECFRTRWLHDEAMYSTNMPAVGDTVTIVGSLQYYQGRTVEFNRGYIESIARQLPPDTTVAEPLTVKLLASSVREVYNCNYVSLYAWQTDAEGSYIGTPLGGWPGTSVPLDSATGWYTYTFGPAIQDVNIIWSRGCDGGYRQTQDIMHVTYNQCFRLMQDSSGIIAVGANCSTVEPILPDTVAPQPVGREVTLRVSRASVEAANWGEVHLYAWANGELFGGWPGTSYLPLDSTGNWYTHTFNTDQESFMIIWNNGRGGNYNQTIDLQGITGSVCHGLRLPEGAELYTVVDLDCNAIDSVTPLPVDSNLMHTVYFYNFLTRELIAADSVPHGGHVDLPNAPVIEGYQFDEWQVGGNLDYVTQDIYVYARYHLILPDGPRPITVRLDASTVPTTWEHIYLKTWTSEGYLPTDQGMGVELFADSTGWYTYTFNPAIQTIDFLFHNDNPDWGLGNQSVDVDRVKSSCCLRMAAPLNPNCYYMIYTAECEIQPQPQPNGITVRLMGEHWAGGWFPENTYIYAWQTIDSVDVPILGAWPGTLMDYSEQTDWNTFTFDSIYQNVNIVFTSSDVQTVDILNVTENTCFQIGMGLGWRNNMYVHEVNVADCSIDPSMYHKVYFLNYEGAVISSLYVVHGDSVTPPVAPEIEGLEFVGWDKDLSSVTENMTVSPIYRVPQGNGIKVQFKSPRQFGWQNPTYLYAWVHADSVDTPILGEWPGQEMQLDTATGWYYYQLPAQYNHFNVVISAPEGHAQTYDIEGIEDNICLGIEKYDWELYNDMYHYYTEVLDCSHTANEYHRVFFVTEEYTIINYAEVLHGGDVTNIPEAPERHGYTFVGWDKPLTNITTDMYLVFPVYEEAAPTSSLKVHLVPTHGIGWENVYIYAWANDSNGNFSHEICGSWPGVQVPVDSLGWCTYTFTHDNLVNIVWNDGISGYGAIHQTHDILNVSSETYYRLYGRDSLMYTLTEILSPQTNPANYRTVAYIDMDFDNELLMMLQQELGTIIELSPTIPYHEGYTFLYWVNVATGAEITPDYVVSEDMIIDEMYDREQYMCYLLDWDGTMLYWANVYHGNSILMDGLYPPYREGFEFIGWSDSLQNITSMRFSVAMYRAASAGNYNVIFFGQNGELLDLQPVNLTPPMPEEIEGYMFIGWRVQENDLSYGTIAIQAIYEWVGPDGMREASGDDHATKQLREGKVYVISPDGKVYGADGKLVETK